MSDEVLLERQGRTLIITINRPEARNAFNLAVAQGLADAVDELDDTPELSVAIITGAGGNFCAGMDLSAGGDGARGVDRRYWPRTQAVTPPRHFAGSS